MKTLYPLFFLIVATAFETSGDAIVRKAIFDYSGLTKLGMMLVGALFLFIYGYTLNRAPLEFGQVVGLYIATLFVMWQFINYFAFGAVPTLPVLVGGSLIVTGGLLITYWKAA